MKDSSIRVRVSHAERIAIHSVAKNQGQTVSDMIRAIAAQGGQPNVKNA
jgi:antitoxin component of RelBE/YafQ-DinJ toxin-antitoxin module